MGTKSKLNIETDQLHSAAGKAKQTLAAMFSSCSAAGDKVEQDVLNELRQ